MAEPIIPSDAVKAIQDSVATATIEVNGREFVTRPVFAEPAESEARAITVNTLQGIVDYVKSDIDRLDLAKTAIHIVGPTEVAVFSGLFGHKQRDGFLYAKLISLFSDGFKFGTYLDCETFIIGVRTLFEQTDGAEQVIKLVGNLTQVADQNNADDGFTQTVTVRRGITMVGNAQVQNPVDLYPYRTFREVAQPKSPFILRITGGDNPRCALFEADGGAWKLEAISNIKEFFQSKEIGLPIIC